MAKNFFRNKKLKNDIILTAVVITSAAVGLLMLSFFGENGDYAVVKLKGEQIYRLSLKENTRKVITGDGYNENVLVIKDGEVFMKSASCPDKICVKHRKIKNDAESIVCLPNKVVVEIIKGDGKELDAVV